MDKGDILMTIGFSLIILGQVLLLIANLIS